MSFYENNIQRVRTDIMNMLNDNDNDNEMTSPCSKKSSCELKHLTSSVQNDEKEIDVQNDEKEIDLQNDEKEINVQNDEKSMIEKLEDEIDLKFKLPPIDDEEDSDYENELEIIDDNERKLKLLKSNYFSCDSIPVHRDDDDEFVNKLIQQNLNDNVYVKFDDKSYKVAINSADPDQSFDITNEKKHCNNIYKTFDAFYENYINTDDKLKQLYIFNKIICNNLIQHPFLIDIVNKFREHIVDLWLQKFNEAQEYYKFSFSEPKKWIKRAELMIFNSKLKKPILEYVQFVGSLLVLFDVNMAYKLNKHLYKNIEMENIKPINFKKDMYTVKELVNYHSYGKNISKVLIQDLIDNISINQNVNIINLDLNLYNRIFAETIIPLEECENDELHEKVEQYILHDNNFPDILKQPIIYIDPDTHQVYIFDYHKLCSNFNEKNYINHYTNKPFEQEFIEQCLEKMKNINLCNYCKDNCTNESKTLKTIYHDSNFGPIILKFCSVDCFSDIEWKPKVILNTII